jgi:hypothetical protein
MYRCHNYLHSLCGLPYSSRSWHCLHLLSSNVCNVYSSQSLDLIPSQLSQLHTPYLSHIDFNIVLLAISIPFSAEIFYEVPHYTPLLYVVPPTSMVLFRGFGAVKENTILASSI